MIKGNATPPKGFRRDFPAFFHTSEDTTTHWTHGVSARVLSERALIVSTLSSKAFVAAVANVAWTLIATQSRFA